MTTWLKYKEWSGILVKGTVLAPVPTTDLHLDHAAYLATSLESSHMGTVQSYDRCGMSGGPFHFTAIQPSTMTQGSLFELLHYLEVTAPCPELTSLWAMFKGKNWFVAKDGTLRDFTSGKQVDGALIRDTFTPPGGKVPQSGPQRIEGDRWTLAFNALLAAPATFKAQQDFAAKYLMGGQKAIEASYYAPLDITTVRVGTPKPSEALIAKHADLALCCYHAHSVNAPAPALKCLKTVQAEYPNDRFGQKAATYLIWLLGTSTYGNWKDDKDGGNRYDNTRLSAMKCGLWPQEFFGSTGIMPVDLPLARPQNTLV